MVNFGSLAAEIGSLVWGTPANFNGFRVLAALLRGTPVVGVSQTVALNRGRHLYSAGRPSRWALANILVLSDSQRGLQSYTYFFNFPLIQHHCLRVLRSVYAGYFKTDRVRMDGVICKTVPCISVTLLLKVFSNVTV